MKQIQKLRRYMPIIILITFVLLVICLVILVIALCCNSNHVRSNDNEAKTETSESFEESTTTKKAKLSAEGPSTTYYYNISEEEKVMIARVVWAEARGECYEGKVAVAAVVLNRYFYGDGQGFHRESIETIITQPYQFASISKATSDELAVNPDCMKAVEDACKGYDPTRKTFEDGALYFYNPKYVKGEEKEKREGIKIMVIGNHNFHYDFKKVE